jgi:hypothetical protein
MLLAFVVFLTLGLGFSALEMRFGKMVWIAAAILAIALSFFLAYYSVSSVWVPNQLTDDVAHKEQGLEVYRGTFPLSQLSYPFSLGVHHLSTHEWFSNNYGYGQVIFSTFFLNFNVFRINGTYSYKEVMGPYPLSYRMNFLFSDPTDFFNFLVFFYAFINIVGALLGMFIGRIIIRKIFIRKEAKGFSESAPVNISNRMIWNQLVKT